MLKNTFALVELLVAVAGLATAIEIVARQQIQRIPLEVRTGVLGLTTQTLTGTMIFSSGIPPVGPALSHGSFLVYATMAVLSPLIVAATPLDRQWRAMLFSNRLSPWMVGGSVVLVFVLYVVFSSLGSRPPGEPIWLA